MRTLTIAAIQTTPVAFDTAASWDRFSRTSTRSATPSRMSNSSSCQN